MICIYGTLSLEGVPCFLPSLSEGALKICSGSYGLGMSFFLLMISLEAVTLRGDWVSLEEGYELMHGVVSMGCGICGWEG